MASPHIGDNYWTLLFKFVQDMQPYVTNYMQPHIGDNLWSLQFKAAYNMGNFTGGGGSGSAQVVTAPSNTTDFSGLPGGVAPTSGVYFAPRDNFTLWTIAANDNQWRVVDKNNP